jgi:hypothetical protein
MQEKFEKYPEAERPGNPVHPLQQIDLSADGIDVSAHDIDIPADETEIMFDSIETAIIGSHGLGGLSRLLPACLTRGKRRTPLKSSSP